MRTLVIPLHLRQEMRERGRRLKVVLIALLFDCHLSVDIQIDADVTDGAGTVKETRDNTVPTIMNKGCCNIEC